MDKAKRWIVLLVVVPLVIGISVWMSIYTEWLWFDALGYDSVYVRVLLTKLIVGVVAGAIFFVFIFGNILVARFLAPKWKVSFEEKTLEKARTIFGKFLTLIAAGVGLFFAISAGIAASSEWETVLKFLNRTSFGTLDPIFKHDIGFYVFHLPFYRYVYAFLMGLLVTTIMVVLVVHFLNGAIVLPVGAITRPGSTISEIRKKAVEFAPHVKAHLSVLLGLALLAKSMDYMLRLYELLYSPRGAAFGASYTDVHAQLPALQILIGVAIFCAILFLVNIYFKGWKLPLVGIGTLIAVSFVAGSVYPALVQNYRVQPSEFALEKKYLSHNISYTRKAYNLDKVEERSFPVEQNLTPEAIEQNQATIKNVRLWDWRPLLTTYSQLQEIRLYYNFNDVDVDRYFLGDEYREVLLSARELSSDKLPAQSWVNKHLTFTHGYGLCLSPVNEVTPEGLPNLLVKDIPPKSTTTVKVSQPEIYYGEKTDTYAIVKTTQKEFDYPKGKKNIYTHYQGKGGVPLDNFIKKVFFAARFGSTQILLSEHLTSESRIMLRRQIKERVEAIAPFLSYDQDPYLVISDDGKLYWMIDGYTTSDKYPYSKPFGSSENYIRNSFKVLVNAYNGDVTFYIVDEKDPLVNTYKKIFPRLFKSFAEMPEDLKKHIRYPSDMFEVQSEMYATYHMQDPQVFYNREDSWGVPNEIFESTEQRMEPYYIIMKLPGEAKEKFILMRPFTPVKKDNMIAWMAVNCEPEDYGKLLVYDFPKQKLVFGPMQIEARIDQDAEISRMLSLWSQRGSQVIRGNLLVIPIGQSLIYVEPLYLKAEQGELPELKRVTVAYGSQIAMEDNFEQALRAIFGVEEKGKKEEEKTKKEKTIDELIDEAVERFSKAQDYQKEGNWAAYGEEIKKLEETLNELKEKAK